MGRLLYGCDRHPHRGSMLITEPTHVAVAPLCEITTAARKFTDETQPTCGARTRAGHPCKRRLLLRGNKCSNHGGMSTGPRTEAGRKIISDAQKKRWRGWRKRRGGSEHSSGLTGGRTEFSDTLMRGRARAPWALTRGLSRQQLTASTRAAAPPASAQQKGQHHCGDHSPQHKMRNNLSVGLAGRVILVACPAPTKAVTGRQRRRLYILVSRRNVEMKPPLSTSAPPFTGLPREGRHCRSPASRRRCRRTPRCLRPHTGPRDRCKWSCGFLEPSCSLPMPAIRRLLATGAS